MTDFRGLIHIGIMVCLTTLMGFGKVADYRFGECNGSVVKNSARESLDGNIFGDANLTVGESSLSLFGSGKMAVDHDPHLDIIKDLTVTFWVNPSEFKRQALIVRGEGSGADRKYGSNAEYSLVLWEDGRFKYKHNRSADTFSSESIAKDSWTHIALVRDHSHKKIEIYINGELDTNSTYTVDPSSSHSEKLLIGTGEDYSSTMHNFSGKIDEIKIYNIVLNQEKIDELYEEEKDDLHLSTVCGEEEDNETQEDPIAPDPIAPDPVAPTPIAAPEPVFTPEEGHFSIGNRVWFDSDEDGLQSPDDQGVEGVRVTLYDDSGNLIESTTTDENGNYLFSDIDQGSYQLGFTHLPENYTFTEANIGADDSKDSDVDATTGRTTSFYLEGDNLSLDAGIIPSFEILEEGESNQTHEVNETAGDCNHTTISGDTEAACTCESYKSSIPSMGQIGMVMLLLLTNILGVSFARKERL